MPKYVFIAGRAHKVRKTGQRREDESDGGTNSFSSPVCGRKT